MKHGVIVFCRRGEKKQKKQSGALFTEVKIQKKQIWSIGVQVASNGRLLCSIWIFLNNLQRIPPAHNCDCSRPSVAPRSHWIRRRVTHRRSHRSSSEAFLARSPFCRWSHALWVTVTVRLSASFKAICGLILFLCYIFPMVHLWVFSVHTPQLWNDLKTHFDLFCVTLGVRENLAFCLISEHLPATVPHFLTNQRGE